MQTNKSRVESHALDQIRYDYYFILFHRRHSTAPGRRRRRIITKLCMWYVDRP